MRPITLTIAWQTFPPLIHVMQRIIGLLAKPSAAITAALRRQKIYVPHSFITERFSMTFWEEKMKNLNEPRRDVTSEKKSEGEVISMEGRRLNTRSEGSLVGTRQMEELRGRWTGIQSSFVDDPRKAV